MRGAIMYVGLNPWEGAEKQPQPLPSGLRPVSGSPQSYVLPSGDRSLVFVPYYRVVQERYNTYFRTA